MFRGRRLLQYAFSKSFLRISKKCVILKFMKPNDAIAIKTRSAESPWENFISRTHEVESFCLEIIFPNQGFKSATVFYDKYMVERTSIGELSERNIEHHVLVNTSIEIAIVKRSLLSALVNSLCPCYFYERYLKDSLRRCVEWTDLSSMLRLRCAGLFTLASSPSSFSFAKLRSSKLNSTS